MSQFAFKRREVKAERIYFIPAGTVIALGDGSSSLTVAREAWPDSEPVTNYSDYAIDDIETLKTERETETETFDIPSAADGYQKDLDEWVTGRMWTAETAKTNALVIMLEEGLTALPVAGTAQIPGARKENYVEGLMHHETATRGIGTTRRRRVWARVYLVTPGDSSSKTSKVQLKFRQMDSSLNSFVVVA